ncbi:MAG: cytochrome c [Acidimicrobiia bacterium]
MRVVIEAVLTVALTLASVALFLTSRDGESPVEPPTGQMVFLSSGCNGCHTLNQTPGNVQIGPDLTHVDALAGSRVDGLSAEEYIRQSLREPQAFVVLGYGPQMPTLALSDEEVDALVELLLESPP